MISLMWDYQQLGKRENEKYIEKMIDKLGYKEQKKLVLALSEAH